ncbi:MAG TPA: hypothetical protein VK586_07065 [Streptosporangiaceae bacterium]|nr:hypothetical protein [Streptosporangiaceae bacterium]
MTEIAPDIYRCSTYLSGAGLLHNQFLIDAEEPLLFHAGLRGLFGSVSAAVARVTPVERLRWITFGHVEADECGSLNSWLAAAPDARVAHGALGCLALRDLAAAYDERLDGELARLRGPLPPSGAGGRAPSRWPA